MPRERTSSKIRSAAKRGPSLARVIVLVDQEPLRHTAAGRCTEAMLRLERARTGWHRFERKDKPAFVRWRAREFGALLTKAREVETQIREGQELVHEVEMEMRRGFQDAHTAYQRVMFRRGHPAEAVDSYTDTSAPSDTSRKLSEFEQEALFQEWVRQALGTNPEKMDDEAYSSSFEAFKSHMFSVPIVEPRPRHNPNPPRREHVEEGPEERELASPVDARIKELYRILVRRLHPDLRANGDTAVSSIWHEVQEAYAAGDVPQLEILLALSDIKVDYGNSATSLGQMQALLNELERALIALEKSLHEAEDEDAWDFAEQGPNEELRVRLERQLKSDLSHRMARLELLDTTIAEWARGPVANRKVR